MILFVRDDLAKGRDPFFDSLDLFRPGAAGVVGIGDAGGIFAFGLGEIFEKVIEFLLKSRAAHGNRLSGVGVGGVGLIGAAGDAPVPRGHRCVGDRSVGGES
jgi:hypothetical protein